MKEYSQEYLNQIRNEYPAPWDISPEEEYNLAAIFTEETATPENFFINSIGFWELKKSRPRKKPDHVSYNKSATWRKGKSETSSEYWYTEDGVIRGSDHWGKDVASCSWYIKGEKNTGAHGVSKGAKKYAFISWKDLKAKGFIIKSQETGLCSLYGFEFKD